MNRLALVTVAAALALAAACGSSPHEAAALAVPAAIAAEVRVVNPAPVAALNLATGTVEPFERVSPGTKLMGRVERVAVREGDRVKAGQLLARLDARDLEAGVGQAKAAQQMAEAQRENAERMFRRMTDLHGRGSATDKNLEDATMGFHVAEAAVAQAKAAVAQAESMLYYAEIKSPVSGYVVARRIEAGDMAAPGMPLFTVEDTARVKVSVRVPESEVVGLAQGSPARIVIEVLNRDIEARVDRVVPAGDPMSRTFDVQLLVDNADGSLKSGMFARASFARGERSVLAVPQSALFERGQLQGLYVVDGEGKARVRWIRAGRSAGGQVEILSGLSGGEKIVVAPPAGLTDGTPVAAR